MKARILLSLLLLSLPAAAEIVDVADPVKIAGAFEAKTTLRVVNLWATWCVPCVAEMKDLAAIHEAWRGRGVEIVAVSLDDAIPGGRAVRRGKVEKFVADRKIPFDVVYYTGRTPPLLDHFGASGELPVTIVYDRGGREVARVDGVIDREAFEKTLMTLTARR